MPRQGADALKTFSVTRIDGEYRYNLKQHGKHPKEYLCVYEHGERSRREKRMPDTASERMDALLGAFPDLREHDVPADFKLALTSTLAKEHVVETSTSTTQPPPPPPPPPPPQYPTSQAVCAPAHSSNDTLPSDLDGTLPQLASAPERDRCSPIRP